MYVPKVSIPKPHNVLKIDKTFSATKSDLVGTPVYLSGIPDMHTIHDPMMSVS
jgi:hypothetical protein